MDELQEIVRFTFHADDEPQAIVRERFRDSDALILHGQNMAP